MPIPICHLNCSKNILQLSRSVFLRSEAERRLVKVQWHETQIACIPVLGYLRQKYNTNEKHNFNILTITP